MFSEIDELCSCVELIVREEEGNKQRVAIDTATFLSFEKKEKKIDARRVEHVHV